ncbi:hypothetical protein Fmac_023195 [Flemingia macrophylla]|uniref:Uncharacterized protein n=1 Tax=Flemingia macrophylla TaxID=520843 RepID=A0ABD1LKV5_9FABA
MVNDRLLHYIYVHMLAPRSSNFAQLLQEDIFMLWALKNNIFINWPHHIMEHMLKCINNNMSLPYALLVTHIMSHYVNGVWQHGTVHRDDDENAHDEDQPMPEDHVADIRQQSHVQHDSQMLSQIWTVIQGLQEGLNNLNITVNTGFNTVHSRIDDLEKKFDDFQQSFQ